MYIVVDLEATCLAERNPDFISEIIEIGAVKVNDKGEVVDTFECFVKPTINPILSNFCTELTSITQKDVDTGLDRKIAFEKFIEFCEDTPVLMSWGAYDRNQLRKEFEPLGLPTDILDKHVNLKVMFSRVLKRNKQYGMAKALNIAGIKLDGTHHRGIDDAKNITKIFQKYFTEIKAVI